MCVTITQREHYMVRNMGRSGLPLIKAYGNPSTSESFIRRHWRKGHGDKTISYRGNLSLGFIEDYRDWLDWHGLCISQRFDEESLERYSGYLDWFCVAMYQHLSSEFVRRHREELKNNQGIYAIENNACLTDGEKIELMDILEVEGEQQKG